MTSGSWKDPAEVDLYTRLPIAVYGTLRSGKHNHARFLAGNPAVVSVELGKISGYELHAFGGLPIAVPRPGASVVVEVVAIDGSAEGDQLRDDLDRLEGFRPYVAMTTGIYDRVLAQAETDDGHEVDCWVYSVGDGVNLADLGAPTRIASGDWVNR